MRQDLLPRDVFEDIADRFEVVENEHLIYVDGPLQGFLRATSTGSIYAFRCRTIGPHLYHWALIPAGCPDASPDFYFSMATRATEGCMGILEDARAAPKVLVARPLAGDSLEHWRNPGSAGPRYGEVVRYIRSFSSAHGESAPYDTIGIFHLALAALDNLAEHHVAAEFNDLAAAVSEPQRFFILSLAESLRLEPPTQG